MWLLKFSLLQALAISNSPYPQQFTLIPKSEITYSPNGVFFIKQISSARTLPSSWRRWGPITTLWTIESGVMLPSGFSLSIGHQSEHGVNMQRGATESMDYMRLEYATILE